MHKDINNQTKFFQLRLDGKTLLEISEELEISLSTANRWNKFFKSDIINTRNSEIEKLKRKFASKYEEYFEFLNLNLAKIREELAKYNADTYLYGDLLNSSLKIIGIINKIDIFKKFSDNSVQEDIPDDLIPETDYKRSFVSKKQMEKLQQI